MYIDKNMSMLERYIVFILIIFILFLFGYIFSKKEMEFIKIGVKVFFEPLLILTEAPLKLLRHCQKLSKKLFLINDSCTNYSIITRIMLETILIGSLIIIGCIFSYFLIAIAFIILICKIFAPGVTFFTQMTIVFYDFWNIYSSETFVGRFLKFYFIPMAVVFILVSINSYFQITGLQIYGLDCNLFYSCPDSSRYMISTIIQSDAAILGLVITLSLFVIQQNSTYSTKIINSFKNINENPDFWILLIIHIVSMTYGSFLLLRIEGNSFSKLFSIQSLESIYPLFYIQTHILFELFLFFLSLLVLIPYTMSTLNLINPTKMIETHISRINKENMICDIKTKKREVYDPMIPIIDIIRQSILRYDNETALCGIRKLKEKVIDIYEDKEIGFEEDYLIATYLNQYFNNISFLAINKMEYQMISEIAIAIEEIGITLAKKEMPKCTQQTIFLLCNMRSEATEKMRYVPQTIEESIYNLERISNELGLNEIKISVKDIDRLSIYS